MRTSESDVVLCPGCPKTGTYIGPLKEPGAGANLRQHSSERPDYAVLFDEDGGMSQAVQLDLAVTELPEFDYENEKKIGLCVERRIVERIGRCVSGTVSSPTDCPAFNAAVLNQVIIDENSNVAARLKEEGN